MKKVYYIGLDVHKDSIQMAVLADRGKEPIAAQKIGGDAIKVVKAIAPYQEQGRVVAGYEAGCLGYTLYRTLTDFGIDCRVLAPQKVFHRDNEEVKTDKRDAIDIAWMLRRDEGESIAIPGAEDEATRDFVRCRADVVEDLKRAKQRMLKFLLRHGVRYESERHWTVKHYAWLAGLKFERALEQATFDEYLSMIRDFEDRIKRLDEQIQETAESERYRERVQRLRAFRGIDYLVALALVGEIGDFRRFPNAGAFMSYLGLVPREQSSGKKRKQGGITKSGNGHIRKLLTESSWHYARPVQVSVRLARRRVGADALSIGCADKAMRRLHKKYTSLVYRGKTPQTAVTAVSRELAGFIWAVMTMGA